jgi:hypothetical protein
MSATPTTGHPAKDAKGPPRGRAQRWVRKPPRLDREEIVKRRNEIMSDNYHFDKTREDAERESSAEDFENALMAAADAVSSLALGRGVEYATVCPCCLARIKLEAELGTLEYDPYEHGFWVVHEDEPEGEATEEIIQDRMVRDAAINLARWVALGSDPSDAPCFFNHPALKCAWGYYEAGGFGLEPVVDGSEDAQEAWDDWYEQCRETFYALICFKAKDLVKSHQEAITRVAIDLSYERTLTGSQVGEIVERVEGGDRSAT